LTQIRVYRAAESGSNRRPGPRKGFRPVCLTTARSFGAPCASQDCGQV